jgi:Spo7-like protein
MEFMSHNTGGGRLMDFSQVIPKDSPAPVDPTVYRDLLIFEESLRMQYVYLQNRRRKYLGMHTVCVKLL